MAALHDRCAVLANAAWLGCGAAGAISADAVHALGDNPCGGGFPRAANTRHHEGLSDPVSLKRVFERAHHRVLANKVGKGFGAVFTRKHLIGGFVSHQSLIDRLFQTSGVGWQRPQGNPHHLAQAIQDNRAV